MLQFSGPDQAGAQDRPRAVADGWHAHTPLLAVLWRRRWTVAATVLLCVLLAAAYLSLAPRTYVSTARLYVEEHAPRTIAGDGDGRREASENFLQTQADVVLSTPVLDRVLEAVNYRSMQTFADVDGDPVEWLRRGGALSVEALKKADVIVVTMESPRPDEAAALVNGVVEAYLAEQSRRNLEVGAATVAVLERERAGLREKRDDVLKRMLAYRRANRVLSFKDEKGNTVLERTATLSGNLTAAEVAVMELRSQEAAVKAAMATPESLASFVDAHQSKGRESGDREYDELRSQLMQHLLTLATSTAVQGPDNRNVRLIQSRIDALRARLAEKQRSIAAARLLDLSSQLAAAEQKERQLRGAVDAQWEATAGMGTGAVEFAKLEADAERLQRESDAIDTRIAEVRVNFIESEPQNVQVLQAGRPAARPAKPNKKLALIAACLAGCVMGVGVALVREWRDARVHAADEVLPLLGLPVIASVPRINARLAPATRGQLVHLDARSPAAEAFRSIRTAIRLGASRDAKTILIASPSSGDGKSTAASNTAIAFAQGGERTLLIDCDLREPVQHLIFRNDGATGLTDVLEDVSPLRGAIAQTNVPNLFLLPCGPLPANPSELLAGKRFARLMATLCGTFDRIVIDSPPLSKVTDAYVLAAAADATLLVLRMNQSGRQESVVAVEGLERVGANVIGAVANDAVVSRAYGYDGGSWMYVADAKRRLPSPPLSGNDLAATRSGDARGSGRHEAGRSMPSAAHTGQTLTIVEPDWSSDIPAGTT